MGGRLFGVYPGYVDSSNGAIFGLIAGHNWQNGSLVFGGEVDVFTSNSGDPRVFVNLRAGHSVSDRTVLFGKVGLRVDDGGDEHKAVGIGVEHAVSDQVSIRLDYERHSEIGNPIFQGHGLIKFGAIWGF